MSVFENHDSESLIGTIIDGRYEIESEQSRSSSSKSFVANDQRSGSQVILRLFSAEASAQYGAELLAEAVEVSEISHPHIVRLTNSGRTKVNDTERVFTVQERLTGGSLQDMIDRNRLLTPSQALVVGLRP
jgi:serine/threonine protein kinase